MLNQTESTTLEVSTSRTLTKATHRRRHLGVALLLTLLAGALLLVPTVPFAPSPSAQEVAEPPAAPALQPAVERTLLFVGDIMLSRGVGVRIRAANDWAHPFRKIAETLRAADLTIGNLECPVSDGGKNQHHLYSFRADPRVLAGLSEAGFDVVSLANNHMYDWGAPALLDTLHHLEEAKIRTVGAGASDLEAHYPLVLDLGGVRLGFLAYVNIEPKYATAGPERPGVAWLDPNRVVEDIRFARPLADVLIILPHWGIEYAKRPSRQQVELAHRMIEAGADLVVGSHPHVVQPVEPYGKGWIAYSLGNFIFDQKDAATHRGLMLKVTLRDKQVAEVTTIPTVITPSYQVEIAPPPPSPLRATKSRRDSGSSSLARSVPESYPAP